MSTLTDKIVHLRTLGCSYKEIVERLQCSKSTVSLACNQHGLGGPIRKSFNLLRMNEVLAERRAINMDNWNQTAKNIYQNFLQPIDIYALGLYKGEGYKYDQYVIGLANSDPSIINTWKRFWYNLQEKCQTFVNTKYILHSHESRRTEEERLKKAWESLCNVKISNVVYDKRYKKRTVINDDYLGCLHCISHKKQLKVILMRLIDLLDNELYD